MRIWSSTRWWRCCPGSPELHDVPRAARAVRHRDGRGVGRRASLVMEKVPRLRGVVSGCCNRDTRPAICCGAVLLLRVPALGLAPVVLHRRPAGAARAVRAARVQESEVWRQTRHDNWPGSVAHRGTGKVPLLTVLMAMMNMVSTGPRTCTDLPAARLGFQPTARAASRRSRRSARSPADPVRAVLRPPRAAAHHRARLLGAVLAIPIWAFAPSLPLSWPLHHAVLRTGAWGVIRRTSQLSPTRCVASSRLRVPMRCGDRRKLRTCRRCSPSARATRLDGVLSPRWCSRSRRRGAARRERRGVAFGRGVP